MELELGLRIAREIANLTFVSTETDAAFLIAAHLPGFSAREIEISVNGEGTVMCISGGGGERSSQEVMISRRLAINRDVCIGHFQKVFPIPSDAISDRIHAVFGEKEAILVVLVPKFTRGELPTIQTDEVEREIEEEKEEIASNHDQEKIPEPEEDEKPDLDAEIAEDEPEMQNEEKVEEVEEHGVSDSIPRPPELENPNSNKESEKDEGEEEEKEDEESPPARPPDPKPGKPELSEISEPVTKPLGDQHNLQEEPKTEKEERGDQDEDSPLTLPEPFDIPERTPEKPDEQEKDRRDLELVEPKRPPESPKPIENSEENPQRLNESHRQHEEAKEEPKPEADDEAKDLPNPNQEQPNEPHREAEGVDRESIGTRKEETEIEREPEEFGEDTDLDLGLAGAGEEEGEKKGRRRRRRGASLPVRPGNLLAGSVFILSLLVLFLRLMSERNRRRR